MSEPRRPDPDELLARVQEEEVAQDAGRLKIFFGAAPGVGKTYTMLEAARALRGRRRRRRGRLGRDPRAVRDRGAARGPRDPAPPAALLPRHAPRGVRPRRWRSSAARPSSWSTSSRTPTPRAPATPSAAATSRSCSRRDRRLHDPQRPAPREPQRRRRADHGRDGAGDGARRDPRQGRRDRARRPARRGAAQASRRGQGLHPRDRRARGRELLPRRQPDRPPRAGAAPHGGAGRRPDARYRHEHAVRETWPTAERVLVCVGPSPYAVRLVRAARRMAARLQAEWVAVYVETPSHLHLADADREQLERTMRLADQLGAETVRLTGGDDVEEILAYARRRNVTKMVVGKPTEPRWRTLLHGSFVERLVRGSGDIDVFVISGKPEEDAVREPVARRTHSRWPAYGSAAVAVALCTLLASLLAERLALANIIMVYLLGVLVVALRAGRGPAALSSRPERRGVRLLLRPPPLHVRRRRHPVRSHLRRDARRRARHHEPRRSRAGSGRGRAGAGAADGGAVRRQSRLRQRRGDVRGGAGGGPPPRRGLRGAGRDLPPAPGREVESGVFRGSDVRPRPEGTLGRAVVPGPR